MSFIVRSDGDYLDLSKSRIVATEPIDPTKNKFVLS